MLRQRARFARTTLCYHLWDTTRGGWPGMNPGWLTPFPVGGRVGESIPRLGSTKFRSTSLALAGIFPRPEFQTMAAMFDRDVMRRK